MGVQTGRRARMASQCPRPPRLRCAGDIPLRPGSCERTPRQKGSASTGSKRDPYEARGASKECKGSAPDGPAAERSTPGSRLKVRERWIYEALLPAASSTRLPRHRDGKVAVRLPIRSGARRSLLRAGALSALRRQTITWSRCSRCRCVSPRRCDAHHGARVTTGESIDDPY